MHLMRVEIDLRASDRAGKLFGTVAWTAAGQLMGEVLNVIVG